MCLLPFGGGSNILIPPTDRARQYANLLRIAIMLHFSLAILLFMSTRYVDGAFDLLGVLVGFFSIRNSEGYSFQQVLCYTIFCGMGFFWSCLRVILYFSGASDTSPDSWQYWVFVVTLTIAPFIYIICTTTAYYLYKEMRTIVNDLQSSMMDGIGGGGGAYGYNDMDYERAAVNSGNNNIWGHNESHPSGYSGGGGSSSTANQNNNTGGFRAFTGAGHRLGQ